MPTFETLSQNITPQVRLVGSEKSHLFFFRFGRKASEEIEEYVSSFLWHPLVTFVSSTILVVIISSACGEHSI